MIVITDTEAKLLIELLEMASNEFGNHGCNDFELAKFVPDLEERRQLIKAFHDYNGDPEEFVEDEKYREQYTWFHDFALMGFLADKIKQQLHKEQ